MDIGLLVTQSVLQFAALLIDPSAPGYVALILMTAFLMAALAYRWKIARHIAALRWLTRMIGKPKTAQQFTFQIDEICAAIDKSQNHKNRAGVVTVWKEYRETLLLYGDAPQQLLRNSVRPSTFINTEDLRMGAGFWRIVPGLFVSIGLFLTFLGLVAALAQTQNLLSDPSQAQSALKGLVGTASAKFIMSLTGLACSILFTAHLRAGLNKIDHALHHLCAEIEKRLPYISLEEVALAQLKTMQANHLSLQIVLETLSKDVNRELKLVPLAVAEISGPLKTEIPSIIASSITKSLEPILNKVLEMSTAGVGDLVSTLSGQLTGQLTNDIGRALGEASAKITQAGDALSAVAGQMNGSSSTLTERLNETIISLTSTLEGIGLATLASSQTAGNLVTDAGRTIAARFDETAMEIAQLSQTMTQRLSQDLLAPMTVVAERLGQMTQEISVASVEIKRLNDGIKLGADQTVVAATAFRTAGETFAKYAAPAMAGADRTEATVAKMQSSVTALERAVVMALGVAESGLQAINGTLDSVSVITGDFARQADRLDTMDETLGRAFERYGVQVDGALDLLRAQISEMRAMLPPNSTKG